MLFEEVVERSLATQVIGEEILEFCTETEVFDFSTVIHVETQTFLTFLGVCSCNT